MYSIAPKGRKYLRKYREQTKARDDVLRRVWREGKFSREFRDKCLMVADIYFYALDETKKLGVETKFLTKAEMKGIQNLIEPASDAYFAYKKTKVSQCYFVDVFGDIPPRLMRSRVNKYIEY